MASENHDESDHMLDAPPTPGTGDVENWEDGGFEDTVEEDIAKAVSRGEEESDTVTTNENGNFEAELAAEMFGSDDDNKPDPIAIDDSDLFGDRIPQELTAEELANFKPDAKTVAHNFFKAPARKSKDHTRSGSNVSAQPPIFSQSTTSKLAKVPMKGKFAKPVPKFNSMTIVPGYGQVTPGSKMAELTETMAADQEAAKHAMKIAVLKAKNKAFEDRRASIGVQATAKAGFGKKGAQAMEEVMHTEVKKPEHYHPDGRKLAMVMEARKSMIASERTKPDQKVIAIPTPRKKEKQAVKAKTAHDLEESKLRSEAVKKGKKQQQDAMLEREENKQIAGLATAKKMADMPAHLQQGEMERQARASRLSDELLAAAAAKNKRKRTEAKSSAPSKKMKTSKMPAHKDLISAHVDEQEDEDEAADEMQGVTVERKIMVHKKTKQLDNIKLGSHSLEKKKITPASAAPQKHNASENSALPSKKRHAEEPDERQPKDITKKKRKVENGSPKVNHTLYQHTEAWRMIRNGYKERNEPVPRFMPHVEGQPSPYASHAENKGYVLPAQPPKEKAKPQTKTNLGPPKFSLTQILAEQEEDAARQLAKEEERMILRARLHAPDRYQGMADRMRGSKQAQEVAADVERLRQEKLEREKEFRASKYSAKDRKDDVKAQQKLDQQWRNVNSGDDSEQSKHTQPRLKPWKQNKINGWEKNRMSTDWVNDPSVSLKSIGQAVRGEGFLARRGWGRVEGEMTSEKRAAVEIKWKRERTFKGLQKTDYVKVEIEKKTWQEKQREEDTRKGKEKAMTRKERKELGKGWKEEKTWENRVGKKRMWRVKGWVKEDRDDGDGNGDE